MRESKEISALTIQKYYSEVLSSNEFLSELSKYEIEKLLEYTLTVKEEAMVKRALLLANNPHMPQTWQGLNHLQEAKLVEQKINVHLASNKKSQQNGHGLPPIDEKLLRARIKEAEFQKAESWAIQNTYIEGKRWTKNMNDLAVFLQTLIDKEILDKKKRIAIREYFSSRYGVELKDSFKESKIKKLPPSVRDQYNMMLK